MEEIDLISLQRASKALRCLKFNKKFYEDIRLLGLNAEGVITKGSKYAKQETNWYRSTNDVEGAFRWLITLGVLRREVDGQGLTSKVRLTPLARKMLEEKPDLPDEHPGILEKAIHTIYRSWPIR